MKTDKKSSKDLNQKEKQLLEKFKQIGSLDYKVIIKELSNIDTISHKLDYLKDIKKNYYDKFYSVRNSLNETDNILYGKNKSSYWDSVFGDNTIHTSLKIPKPIYNKFFKNGYDIPEFTFWFLKYLVEQAFNNHVNTKTFKSNINSNLKKTFIQAELKQLDWKEQQAKELLGNKKFDIYDESHPNNYKYQKEFALLRVLAGNYYKENTCFLAITGTRTIEVQAYFKQILLKPYLEKLLRNLSLSQDKPNLLKLSNLISGDFSKEITDKIIVQYKNIRGKQLKLLFLALQEFNLIPKERFAKKFHNACKNDFNWDIGTYQAMNDYHLNLGVDKESFESMKLFLTNIRKN